MYKLVDDLRKFYGVDWFLVLPCGCCCCCWLFGVKLEPPRMVYFTRRCWRNFCKNLEEVSINNVYIMLIVDVSIRRDNLCLIVLKTIFGKERRYVKFPSLGMTNFWNAKYVKVWKALYVSNLTSSIRLFLSNNLQRTKFLLTPMNFKVIKYDELIPKVWYVWFLKWDKFAKLWKFDPFDDYKRLISC